MVLKLPRVQDACCCWSLETCCHVQGYFVLAYSVAASILAILGAIWALNANVMAKQTCSSWNINGWCDSYSSSRDMQKVEFRDWTFVVFVIMAIVSILTIISTVAFLRGIFKKQPSLLVYYIKCLAAHLLLTVLTTVWAFMDTSSRFPQLVHDFIKYGLFFYLLVCANSVYEEMSLNSNQEVEDGRHDGPTAPTGPPPPYGKAM